MDKKVLKDAISTISSVRADLEGIRDQAQEDFDEKSDKWKEGDTGVAMEGRINSLNDAIDVLESAESSLDEAIGG